MSNDSVHNNHRKRLTDVLNGGTDTLRTAWDATAAAAEFAPLPAGTYVARLAAGEPSAARSGTPGYKLTFRVLEGPHAGRYLWHDLWLTAAALPMTKRDLAKLGVMSPEQLERPLPPGIRCRVQVALRREDDGREHNRVRSFEVVGVDDVADDDFPPAARDPSPEPGDGGGSPPAPAAATPPPHVAPAPVAGGDGQASMFPAGDRSVRPWEVNA